MATPTKRVEITVCGGDAHIANTPTTAKVLSLKTGQYLWIGTEASCFGWVSDLRALRKLHTGLGAMIKRRERKAVKKRTATR